MNFARTHRKRFIIVAAMALLVSIIWIPRDAHRADASPDQLDVLFIFDVTGSMSGALSEAKAQVADAISAIRDVHPTAHFGIASVSDYAPDVPWQLNQSITDDSSLISAAVNGLRASGGGDGPEAYTRALYEASADAAVAWRAGSQRLVVLVNDNMPHDDDLNEGVPAEIVSYSSPFNTGVDPGRDGIAGTPDDLDWQATLQLLKSEGIVFASVLYSGASRDLAYWEWWTRLTGGTSAAGGGSVPLGDILVDLVFEGVGSGLVIRALPQTILLAPDPGTEAFVQVRIKVEYSDGTNASGAVIQVDGGVELTANDAGVLTTVLPVDVARTTAVIDATHGSQSATLDTHLYDVEDLLSCRRKGNGGVGGILSLLIPHGSAWAGSVKAILDAIGGASELAKSDELTTSGHIVSGGLLPELHVVRTDADDAIGELFSFDDELTKQLDPDRASKFPSAQLGRKFACGGMA